MWSESLSAIIQHFLKITMVLNFTRLLCYVSPVYKENYYYFKICYITPCSAFTEHSCSGSFIVLFNKEVKQLQQFSISIAPLVCKLQAWTEDSISDLDQKLVGVHL